MSNKTGFKTSSSNLVNHLACSSALRIAPSTPLSPLIFVLLNVGDDKESDLNSSTSLPINSSSSSPPLIILGFDSLSSKLTAEELLRCCL